MLIAIAIILDIWVVERMELGAPMEINSIVPVGISVTMGEVSDGEIGRQDVGYTANAITLAHIKTNKTDSGAQMG